MKLNIFFSLIILAASSTAFADNPSVPLWEGTRANADNINIAAKFILSGTTDTSTKTTVIFFSNQGACNSYNYLTDASGAFTFVPGQTVTVSGTSIYNIVNTHATFTSNDRLRLLVYRNSTLISGVTCIPIDCTTNTGKCTYSTSGQAAVPLSIS